MFFTRKENMTLLVQDAHVQLRKYAGLQGHIDKIDIKNTLYVLTSKRIIKMIIKQCIAINSLIN